MGVLKVRVNGVWEEVNTGAEPPLDEVWVGAGPPDPVGSYEVWIDSTIDPAVLHFKNQIGQWTKLDTGNEVTVAHTDPYVTNPLTADELWYDTGSGVPGTLNVRAGNAWVPVAPLATSVRYATNYGEDPVPGTLRTYAREDHGHGTPPEEVVIHDDDPYTRDPDSEAELWYDTSSVPPVLKVRINNAWEPVSAESGSEVTVGNVDPYVTDPAATDELWFNPSMGVLSARVNNQWLETNPAAPNEVTIQGSQPTNPDVELWYDPAAVPVDANVEEVVVSPDDPLAANPAVELWYDTDAVARETPGTNEVYIGATNPEGLPGQTNVDLWYNTNTQILMVKDDRGGWSPIGLQGPEGPQGPTGVSTIIVGSFGDVATPASLPVDGLIPVDWDGPGNPAAPQQMNQGESLYYDKTGDPLDGHLFQYVTDTIDPTGWIDVGLIQGPPGPAGADGPAGVDGPPGPMGPPLPVGGTAGQVLSKVDGTDGNVQWGGDVVMTSGSKIKGFGTVLGDRIVLYESGGSRFGLGIDSGTMSFFVPDANLFKFRSGSNTGTVWAQIAKSGVHVWGNHFSAETDGMGLKMVGGAHIYKQAGGGLILRRASGTNEVTIEDSAGGNRRNIATKPDSEATVAHNATNFDEVRAGQNYILYNDSIVCWHVTLTPKVLWEGSWQECIPPNGYPDFLRPSRMIEQWGGAVDSSGNATCVGLGIEIQPGGKVSIWKPGDGPDIKGHTIININFVYPRNY